jgi:ComF family protein
MILEQIISLIAPHYCLGCDKVGDILCHNCTETVEELPSRCYSCQLLTEDYRTCRQCDNRGLEQVFCATGYSGLPKKLVRKLKFGRSPVAAKVMAGIMAKVVPDSNWVLIPIPTASSRVRRRGYDQAQLIAKHLADNKNISYSPLLLRHGQKRQVGQTRQQRQAQIVESFSLKPANGTKLTGRNILLVDDVLTTGATLESAAKVLWEYKPAKICGATFSAA